MSSLLFDLRCKEIGGKAPQASPLPNDTPKTPKEFDAGTEAADCDAEAEAAEWTPNEFDVWEGEKHVGNMLG